MNATWVKDAFWVATATLTSRVLGLVREIVVADQFGASAVYDAYLVAFFIPHFLRRLLAEGTLSNAFVPLYAERLQQGRAQADAFGSTVLSVALLGFPIVIGIGEWLAPALVAALADGFDASQQALTVHLARITFPFIGLVGLGAVVMGVLNSHGKFGVPALAPALLNVGIILSVLLLRGMGAEALAIGVLLGGMAQLLVQLPLLKGRFHFRWRPDWRGPGLRQLGRMLAPAFIGLAVVQINVLVDNKLASHLPEGAISALQYAIRLFQLPLGVFAVAISTAILPQLSIKSHKALQQPLRQAVLLCALVLLPAGAGLWVLGRPVIELLFEHGAFTPEDTTRTLNALRFYTLGLLPYGLVSVLTRAFYATKDGNSLVWLSALAVGVNVALSLSLVGPMAVGGLALATGIAGWVQLVAMGVVLCKRLGVGWLGGVGKTAALAGAATLAMVVVVTGVLEWTRTWSTQEWLLVVLPAWTGALAYGGLMWRLLRAVLKASEG